MSWHIYLGTIFQARRDKTEPCLKLNNINRSHMCCPKLILTHTAQNQCYPCMDVCGHLPQTRPVHISKYSSMKCGLYHLNISAQHLTTKRRQQKVLSQPISNSYPLVLCFVAIDNGPFIIELPITNDDFP